MSLYIGTCSWKYPSWEGLLYETGSGQSYLAQYAKLLNTVEVDQWFWSLGRNSYALPESAVVNEYNRDTPPDFRFTIKAPNTLTVGLNNPWFLDVNVLYQFVERIASLESKIGLIIFQFGYLNKEIFANQNEFYDALGTFFALLPDSFPFGIEIRNPSFITEQYFSLLHQNSITPVLASGYWNDSLSATLSHYHSFLGNRLGVRLLGEDRKRIEAKANEAWNALYEPKDEELKTLTGFLKQFLDEGKEIFVNVNNHYEGSAPLTITRLQSLLQR